MIAAAVAAHFVGGTLAGMAFGDIVGAAIPMPTTMVAPTAAASEPTSTKKKLSNSEGMSEAKETLWYAAFVVVVAIAILGFGSRYLNNIRIA